MNPISSIISWASIEAYLNPLSPASSTTTDAHEERPFDEVHLIHQVYQKSDNSNSVFNLMQYFARFGGYQAQTLTLGALNLIKEGKGRDDWPLYLHWMLYVMRTSFLFDKTTFFHGRQGYELLQWAGNHFTTFPDNVEKTDIQIPVNKEKILEFEQKGDHYRSRKGAPGYPVPEEVEPSNVPHSLKGEWYRVPPKEQITERQRGEPKRRRKVILYVHGGAYCIFSPFMYRHLTGNLAADTDYDVFCTSYRLAPESPFPAGLHDAFTAYLWLLNPRHEAFGPGRNGTHFTGHAPEDIILAGDSAGKISETGIFAKSNLFTIVFHRRWSYNVYVYLS